MLQNSRVAPLLPRRRRRLGRDTHTFGNQCRLFLIHFFLLFDLFCDFTCDCYFLLDPHLDVFFELLGDSGSRVADGRWCRGRTGHTRLAQSPCGCRCGSGAGGGGGGGSGGGGGRGGLCVERKHHKREINGRYHDALVVCLDTVGRVRQRRQGGSATEGARIDGRTAHGRRGAWDE